jgi:type IV secretory pathway VirB4 component
MDELSKTAPGKNNRNKKKTSTQANMRVAEIRDNVVVLKNGGLRTVLKTNSINFNLKSEEEQNAIIYSYQSFLNSLEFPIQILVRSKKLDIDDYIDQVNILGEKQENKLLQEQTFEYAQYIQRLVEYADIMEKQFYVIVPYEPGYAGPSATGVFQSFFQRLSPTSTSGDVKKRHSTFDSYKKSLLQRVGTVKSGLENAGLKVDELNTLELIELFYESYNPLTSQNQKLRDPEETAIQSDEEKLEEEKAAEEAAKV